MEVPERLDVTVDEDDPRITVSLLGSRGHVLVGGGGSDGYVRVRDSGGGERVRLDGRQGAIYAGGDGAAARVFLRKPSGASEAVTVRLDAGSGNIRAGGNGCDGDVLLFPRTATTLWTRPRPRSGSTAAMATWRSAATAATAIFWYSRGMQRSRRLRDDDATVWLNGDRGDVWLTGGLKPRRRQSGRGHCRNTRPTKAPYRVSKPNGAMV